MKNQKMSAKRSIAVVLSLALAAAPLAIATDADAAAKPTIAKKTTITAGKSKKLSISKNGFTIKKVSAKTSAKKVATVKATKKAITIKAAKKGSATITTTIKAAKGKKKAKSYKATTKVTVKAAAVKAVTVNTLAGLESALASAQKSGAAVTLKTDEAGTLEIKAADYTKVALTVDAPNADIVNAAKFKSVTIKAIKASTWTEKASGNKLEVAATTATRIVVDATASVASIVYSGTSAATSKVEVLGTVNNISVESNTPVEVSAAGASAKVAEIDVKAEGVKVDITADATATISTVKVEANASVSVGGTSNNPTSVQKIPTATVVVTAPNATTTEITPQPSASPAASASPSASASASPSASATPAKSEEPATGAGGSVDAFTIDVEILGEDTYTVGDTATALTTNVTNPNSASLTYAWYKASTNSVSSSDTKVGENATYTPDISTTGTQYIYVKVAGTKDGQTIEKTSEIITVLVKVASSDTQVQPKQGTDWTIEAHDTKGSKLTSKFDGVLEYELRSTGAELPSGKTDSIKTLAKDVSVQLENAVEGSVLFIWKQATAEKAASSWTKYVLNADDVKVGGTPTAKTLSKVEVTTQPTKVHYVAGDALNPAGLKITLTYSDDSTEEVTYSESNKSKFTFSSGYDNLSNTSEKIVINVTYEGQVSDSNKSISVDASNTVDSIAIKTAPNKVSYTTEEKIDPTGLVITVTYSNQATKEVAYSDTNSGITLSPDTDATLTTENNKLTVTYDSKTAEVNITVTAE